VAFPGGGVLRTLVITLLSPHSQLGGGAQDESERPLYTRLVRRGHLMNMGRSALRPIRRCPTSSCGWFDWCALTAKPLATRSHPASRSITDSHHRKDDRKFARILYASCRDALL